MAISHLLTGMDNWMLLGTNKQTSLFQHNNNQIEIRWYDQPGDSSYLAWKLTNHEIDDLLSWWSQSGIRIEKEELPLKEYKYKNISISMYTMKTISIRGIDGYGQLKQIGASFQIEILENMEAIVCQSNSGG